MGLFSFALTANSFWRKLANTTSSWYLQLRWRTMLIRFWTQSTKRTGSATDFIVSIPGWRTTWVLKTLGWSTGICQKPSSWITSPQTLNSSREMEWPYQRGPETLRISRYWIWFQCWWNLPRTEWRMCGMDWRSFLTTWRREWKPTSP